MNTTPIRFEKLYVWSDDEDWVIASNKEEAIEILAKTMGETTDVYYRDYSCDLSLVQPGTVISVGDENGQNQVKKTAAEWIDTEPKGLLCSRNF